MMKDFYRKTPEDQAKLLKKLALRALESWDVGREVELELIKHRENAVFKVKTPGAKYVVRVHRWGYHSDNALRSELQWMEALLQHGIDTPEVIRTRQGDVFTVAETKEVPELRQVDLFTWIDGVPISDLTDKKNELSMHHRIGQLMAGLHNHAEKWTPPQGFTRHCWDAQGLLGDNPVWGRFWELSHFTDEERRKILKARKIARQQLENFGKTGDRYGLIHCDFLPENLLKDGKTLRIIDFDDCGFGWHLFDIVTSIFAYILEDNVEAIKAAFIQGYRSKRELSDEQLNYYDLFVLLRVMTSCGWIHTRPETQTAKEFGTILADYLVLKVDEFLTTA